MQNGKLNVSFLKSPFAFSGQITAYGVWNNMRMSNDIHFWVNDYLNKTAECKKVDESLRSAKTVKSIRKRLSLLVSSAHIRTTPTALSSVMSLATVLQNLAFRSSMALLPS